MASETTVVGVIGLGTMGAGIVEVFARGGAPVIGVETTNELADRGRVILQASTDRAVAKGKLDEQGQRDILARITITTNMSDLAPAGLVVEAVPERLDLKHQVFSALDKIVSPQAILASNTSSLSITSIASGTAHPERVVGLHFFNPAPILKLVEVITTLTTPPELVVQVSSIAEAMGKKPVVVRDRAGFVANYLLFGYLNSAMAMIEHGQVSREDLDTAMRVGAGLPMGPLTLMDLIGLDVCHHIGEVIYGHSRDRVHGPSSILEQMVAAGRLGRKSGRGFYTYAAPNKGSVVADDSTPPPLQQAPSSVAVIGSSPIADDLVARFTAAGVATSQVTDINGDLSVVARADLVIEAQGEPSDPTQDQLAGQDANDLFAKLGAATAAGTVLTSINPASVAALAALTGRAEDTVVWRMHAPTQAGQVIEVGRTIATSEASIGKCRAAIAALEAHAVLSKDRTGLVVDALLMPHLNDAVRMVDQGYASAQDIDTAIQFGLGYPKGPLAMIDEIGSDEVLATVEDLMTGSYGFETHLVPSPLLVEHVLLDLPFHRA